MVNVRARLNHQQNGVKMSSPVAVNYAERSGRLIGTMRILKIYLDEIEKWPDMKDFYLGKIRETVTDSLSEMRSDNDRET